MNHETECLLPPGTSTTPPDSPGSQLPAVAEDELVFEAKQKITLRCGKASITLYPNGKIALRGEYIVSDAVGVNRIAGGQIELN
ncbi:hypothetical protein B7760_00753 [Burkholderia glumae]|uniref:hypothetical protein n=1 Tax=Burkholderia glumae TaxID=337 RepID=UPI001373F22A|nr:hypothetical protein [Burkholderia glumae]MCR1770936.1 hypothetical protein [Burkholderia glumae]QHP89518.1 hypothetical protein EXE55_00150 [Burkholderia glumae]QKM46752.1 hypothetical protein B7760_00753 [Burkholderia glumae]